MVVDWLKLVIADNPRLVDSSLGTQVGRQIDGPSRADLPSYCSAAVFRLSRRGRAYLVGMCRICAYDGEWAGLCVPNYPGGRFVDSEEEGAPGLR